MPQYRPPHLRDVKFDWASTIPLGRASELVAGYYHQLGYFGEGKVIANVDSGIDPNHPMLRGAVIPNTRWDDNDPYGHGTATGICAVGRRMESELGALFGTAPMASIKSFRCLDSNGYGDEDMVVEALRRAIKFHPNIINFSVGADTDRAESEVNHLLEEAILKGIIVVVPSGNFGSMGNNEVAMAKGVITVGAKCMSGEISTFSSPSVAPQVLAPGGGGCRGRKEWIYTGTSLGSEMDTQHDRVRDGFSPVRGTSFSGPLIAGGIADGLEAGDSLTRILRRLG